MCWGWYNQIDKWTLPRRFYQCVSPQVEYWLSLFSWSAQLGSYRASSDSWKQLKEKTVLASVEQAIQLATEGPCRLILSNAMYKSEIYHLLEIMPKFCWLQTSQCRNYINAGTSVSPSPSADDWLLILNEWSQLYWRFDIQVILIQVILIELFKVTSCLLLNAKVNLQLYTMI